MRTHLLLIVKSVAHPTPTPPVASGTGQPGRHAQWLATGGGLITAPHAVLKRYLPHSNW